MDEHVKDFFLEYSEATGKGSFHRVIALHEAADVNWETVSQLAPQLPKGWFELCELQTATRIQFCMEFWLSKIPYNPNLDQALSQFFGSLDDLGVFLTQKTFDAPIEAQMVYSLSGNRGFYRGAVNAVEEDLIYLQKLFPDYILPEDYLAFLQIHNGFCKATDCTGIIKTSCMKQKYEDFQELLRTFDQLLTKSGRSVNPNALIPFYESFGMPFFQCFWGDWYPSQEMGNVYYSGADNTISDPLQINTDSSELMAFPTFTDWLIFYLERIES
jgi:hypothetical protein